MSAEQLIGERNSAMVSVLVIIKQTVELIAGQYALEASVKMLRAKEAALRIAEEEAKTSAQNVHHLEDLYAEALEAMKANEKELANMRAINQDLQLKQQRLMRILSNFLVPEDREEWQRYDDDLLDANLRMLDKSSKISR